MPKRINLAGQTFGDLTVVKLSDRRDAHNTLLWECLCSCGKTIYVSGGALRAGYYKSCGCKQVIKRDQGAMQHVRRDRVDGTRKTALKAKLNKRNKTGHKGVTWVDDRKKWRSYIGIKGKQISLGYFDRLEDAISARIEAENRYHRPYLEGEKDGD